MGDVSVTMRVAAKGIERLAIAPVGVDGVPDKSGGDCGAVLDSGGSESRKSVILVFMRERRTWQLGSNAYVTIKLFKPF